MLLRTTHAHILGDTLYIYEFSSTNWLILSKYIFLDSSCFIVHEHIKCIGYNELFLLIGKNVYTEYVVMKCRVSSLSKVSPITFLNMQLLQSNYFCSEQIIEKENIIRIPAMRIVTFI